MTSLLKRLYEQLTDPASSSSDSEDSDDSSDSEKGTKEFLDGMTDQELLKLLQQKATKMCIMLVLDDVWYKDHVLALNLLVRIVEEQSLHVS